MSPRLRNDLNGIRIKLPGTKTIYLIDEGKKRRIRNREMYCRVFADSKNIYFDINIDEIKNGPELHMATLIKYEPEDTVYLLDGHYLEQAQNILPIKTVDLDRFLVRPSDFIEPGTEKISEKIKPKHFAHFRRPIMSSAVFNHYNFDWEKIHVIPAEGIGSCWVFLLALSLPGNPIKNPPDAMTT